MGITILVPIILLGIAILVRIILLGIAILMPIIAPSFRATQSLAKACWLGARLAPWSQHH